MRIHCNKRQTTQSKDHIQEVKGGRFDCFNPDIPVTGINLVPHLTSSPSPALHDTERHAQMLASVCNYSYMELMKIGCVLWLPH